MTIVLVVLLVIAMLATLGVLFAGIFGFVRGGDPGRSNALMRWRVVLQGVALLIVVALLSMLRH